MNQGVNKLLYFTLFVLMTIACEQRDHQAKDGRLGDSIFAISQEGKMAAQEMY